MYILGDFKSSQATNEDLPPQKPPRCFMGGDKLPQILLVPDTLWQGELRGLWLVSKLCPLNTCCASLVEFFLTKPHFFIVKWRTWKIMLYASLGRMWENHMWVWFRFWPYMHSWARGPSSRCPHCHPGMCEWRTSVCQRPVFLPQ